MDAAAPSEAKPKRRRWSRKRKAWLLGLLLAPFVGAIVLWILIHRVEWMGPLVANTLRAIIGTENVTRLEDFVYGVEDRFNRVWRKDEKPKAYWEVPAEPAKPPTPAPESTAGTAPLPPFEPEDPGPVHKSWSAPGDGQWVPIGDPRRPNEAPYLYKTLLHPDENRSWSELFVVAVDLRRVRIHPVPGTREPKSEDENAPPLQRPGVIPEIHHEELLAAFNGGFMTEHGGWGMAVGGTTIVPPKKNGCTLVAYKDDRVRIASWHRIADTADQMRWFRQGPECMFEDGEMHAGLTVEGIKKWGATLDGDTVIRRSAIALNDAGDILYVGISNHTTARVMADGMHHLGAPVVMQMDVNWSYPKFVLFEPKDNGTKRLATALAPGFEFSEDEYIRKPSRRDFFYLMRRDEEYPSSETARGTSP